MKQTKYKQYSGDGLQNEINRQKMVSENTIFRGFMCGME